MARANLFRITSIIVVGLLMLAVWTGVRVMVSEQQIVEYDFEHKAGRRAVHSTVVTVPREEWDTYFDKLRGFAKANDFKIRVKRFRPGFDIFFVDLWRSDVLLLGATSSTLPSFIF